MKDNIKKEGKLFSEKFKELRRHPDYTLEDQAKGRCPYCLASADMDCNCEKKVYKR
jgi:hypothetical protein